METRDQTAMVEPSWTGPAEKKVSDGTRESNKLDRISGGGRALGVQDDQVNKLWLLDGRCWLQDKLNMGSGSEMNRAAGSGSLIN